MLLNHYGIRGVLNDWFKSYLSYRNQYVSLNRYESGLAAINCGVHQGSVLGPLLFLLYLNDLNQAVKFCEVQYFVDDTNLLCLSSSIKNTNLTWQYHVIDLSIKLNRANTLLFKMRKYVSLKILRSIYFAIFYSYLSYYYLVWTQNCSTIQRILILQKKTVRIINSKPRNLHTSCLFK